MRAFRIAFQSVIFTFAAAGGVVHANEAFAQFKVGEDVQTIRVTPLKSGETTLLNVPSGSVLTVKRLHGQHVLVTIDKNSQRMTGWVSGKDILAMPAEEEAELPKELPKAEASDPKIMPNPTSFLPAAFSPQREKARKAMEMPEGIVRNLPQGWSICPLDPKKVVDAFGTLSVKPGQAIKAYQYSSGGNGNGIVWALPTTAPFPDPNTIVTEDTPLFKPPRPPKAYDNYMEAIQGDRSAKSFLEASILKRELGEVGALWHGIKWGMHKILCEDPWKNQPANDDPNAQPGEGPMAERSKWTWHKAQPTSWAPVVTVDGDVVRVTFYTYSPMYTETIFRHVDEYRPGEYRFTTETTKIGTGIGGIAF